jgi:DNA repair protein RadC
MITNSHCLPPPFAVPCHDRQYQKPNNISAVVRVLLLVHNHPSGDPTPSQADVQMTKEIIGVAQPLGISVHYHIIVGRDGHASLKGLKLM